MSELAASLDNNTASDSSVAHEAPTEADGQAYDEASDTSDGEEGGVLQLADDAGSQDEDGDLTDRSSMSKTPEQILAEQAGGDAEAVEIDESADDIIAREDAESQIDGFGSDADIREANIEMDNQTVEDLAEQAGETGSETIDRDEPLG